MDKKPFLEGKLTAISVAILALAQSPNIVNDLIAVPQTFQSAANQPLSVISLIASAGVVYGALRRTFGYFKRK